MCRTSAREDLNSRDPSQAMLTAHDRMECMRAMTPTSATLTTPAWMGSPAQQSVLLDCTTLMRLELVSGQESLEGMTVLLRMKSHDRGRRSKKAQVGQTQLPGSLLKP